MSRVVERLFLLGATGLSAVCDCGISYSFTIFVIVDEPKYTRTTSVYCVTDYVCII